MKQQPRSLKKLKELQKRQLGLNQLLKPALYLFLSFCIELIGFLVLGFKYTDGSTQILPSYFFFDVGLWLFIASLMICTPKNWIANTIFYISMSIKSLLLVANITLRSGFGYLFSWDMTDLIIEALESIDADFINFPLIFACIFAVAIVVALPILFDKFLKKYKITIKKITKTVFCLLCFFVASTLGVGSYGISIATLKVSATHTEISSDEYLYENMHIKDAAYKKFGTAGFYVKNLYDICFKKASISEAEKQEALKLLEESNATVNANAPLYDNNLIIIMMESFEWFAIDPYNTPTLWALKTGQNYYADHVEKQAVVMSKYISNNKTNVSEEVCLLGYMPNVNKLNLNGEKSYSAKYSLPNLFKSLGYTTSFFHNWKKDFYNRETINKEIGFDNQYYLEDFVSATKSTRFNYYNLEVDFANQFMNKIAPTDKKFMSFYTTVSTHGSYEVTNEKFNEYYSTYDANLANFKTWCAEENYVFPANENDQLILKHYKSAAMDTDRMLANLFKHLKSTGLNENTTVILYSDHNAYYHDLAYKIKGTNINEYDNQSSYTVPFMIYSKNLTSEKITRFCSPYDLYPTISGLFGLAFNGIYAQGVDIISTPNTNTFYMSYLTGFYDANCYSKDMLCLKKYEGSIESADVTVFKDKACKFFQEQKVLETIYRAGLTY